MATRTTPYSGIDFNNVNAPGFRGGSFDPQESGDPTRVLQQSFTQQNRGAQRVAQAIERNNAANIRGAGKLWGDLAKFSPNVNTFLESKHEGWKKSQLGKAHEFYYQNGMPADQREAYLALRKGADDSAYDAKLMADKWEADGGDIWTSERFRKLSPQAQAHVVEFFLQDKMMSYNPDLIPAIAMATDPTERNAALTAYRGKFFEQFAGFSEDMVYDQTHQKMREIEKLSYSKWNTTRTDEIKAERLERSTKALANGLKGDNPHEAILYFSKFMEGDYGSLRASRKAAMDIAKQLAENGLLDDDQINKLEKGTFIAHDGTKKVFGTYYEDEFVKLRKAYFSHIAEMERIRQGKETIEANRSDRDSFDGFIKSQEPIKKEDVETKLLELKKRFPGRKFPRLETLNANFTVEAEEIRKYTKLADKLARMGALTNERLHEMPYEVIRKFQDVATRQTASNDTHALNLKSLEDKAKSRVQGLADGSRDPSVRRLISEMQVNYSQLAEANAIAGIENPEQAAYEQVIKWFEDKVADTKSGFHTATGYDLNQTGSLGQVGADVRDKITHFEHEINIYGDGALDVGKSWKYGTDATPFFHKRELLKMTPKRGQLLDIHPRVTWLAKRMGVSEITVLNRQRKALGLPELDKTPSIESSEKLNPKNQSALNQAQTGAQYSRAWGSYFADTGEDFVSAIVPDGLGEELKKVSEELGLSPATIAAGMDIDIWDPSASKNDIPDDAKEMYWQSVYKYSGGSDATALQQLMRF